MLKVWNWIKNNPIRSMFLLPILLVAGISISHVVSWYDMANPISWAIYLSIAIEVGAITALVAATNRIKGGIWFMFGIVTFIQMLGNIFYSYKEIDPNGDLFKSWVELTGPVWEAMGTELTDTIGMKRWLAFLEGGLLPIISLTSLHFFVKYEEPSEKTAKVETEEREESKAKRVKAPTPTPVLPNEEYFDEINHLEHLKEMSEELDEILEGDLEELKEDEEQTIIIEPLKNMEVVTPEELKERIEKKNRENLNISNEKNWIRTDEEKNSNVGDNIKRLIYKK